MTKNISSQKITAFVIIISLLIAVILGMAIWDINFWPTDTKVFYFDATIKIPHLKHLSQIHDGVDKEKIRWLHGKELFLLAASFMQRLMNDFETLRPFIMVCLISICLSSLLIYRISRTYWGEGPALICWFAFTASMWPYIYILFAKHQPLGLVFFLLAIVSLQQTEKEKTRKLLYFLSGLCMGASFFSSSASAIYFPYYAAAFVYILQKSSQKEKARSKIIKDALVHGLLAFLGMIMVLAYVNWPHLVHNIKSFIEYVNISGSYNHFFYNQAFLQQWFLYSDVASVRGGLLWIIKYFFVIMPVLFPVYLLSVLYLIVRSIQTTDRTLRRRNIGMIVLSLSSPLMAEIIQAAQYGANYFPSMAGIIMLVGYCAYLVKGTDPFFFSFKKKGSVPFVIGMTVIGTIACLHLTVNAYAFVTDIYPCRMVTTFLSRKIKELNIEKLYTYRMNPHRNHFVMFLNPGIYKNMRLVPIEYIIQPEDGFIMVPPVTGDSIYIVSISTYMDFDDDVFLNELLRKGNLEDYALASFKTMANSRIWIHEEEILSYRNLILNHQFKENDVKGRVWILDGKKIFQHLKRNIPIKDYLDLDQQNIRNIGTKKRLYIYEGYTGRIGNPRSLKRLLARIYKVGNPTDSLIAYVYKVDEKQVVWVRLGEHFTSIPLSGETLSRSKEEGLGVFSFDPPLKLNRGSYFFLIYRTGEKDDENFYRILNSDLGML